MRRRPNFAPAELLAALKHPLAACGMEPAAFPPRRPPDGAEAAARPPPRQRAGRTAGSRRTGPKDERVGDDGADRSPAPSQPLRGAPATAAEPRRLRACWRRMSRLRRLWPAKAASGAARTGKRRRNLLADLEEGAGAWPSIQPADYAALFDELAAGQTVRLAAPGPSGPRHSGPAGSAAAARRPAGARRAEPGRMAGGPCARPVDEPRDAHAVRPAAGGGRGRASLRMISPRRSTPARSS